MTKLFIFLMTAVSINCLPMNNAKMAVEYFSYQNVKHACAVSCADKKWLRDFARLMTAKGIGLSGISPKSSWKDLELCMAQEHTRVGVMLDIGCDGSRKFMEQCSEDRFFDSMHFWLMFQQEGNSVEECIPSNIRIQIYNASKTNISCKIDETIALLGNLNLSIDAEISLAILKNSHSYDLFDVYNFGRIQGGHLNVTNLGSWTIAKGMNVWLTGFKYKRRWDFNQLTMRAISVMQVSPKVFTPELLTRQAFTPGVSAMTKISSMVLDLFREKHNFRLNYTIADRWVGSNAKNSTLAVSNSMVWREQDISSTSLRIFPTCLNWMDPFFPHITYLETKFYYRIPSDGVGRLENEFLRPFTYGVWCCVLCAGVICALVLGLSAKTETRPQPVQFGVFSVAATFCQQVYEDGPDPDRRTTSSGQGRKSVLFVTGLSSLLLYNYYTSSVVSWLLSAPPPSIASLEELSASSLEVIMEDIGYTRSWLEVPGYYYGGYRSIKEEKFRDRLRKKSRKLPIFQSVDDGIEYVRKGGFAYHTEPYSANIRIGHSFNEQELCDVGSLQMMPRMPVYLVGQHRSPYRHFFIWSMIRALERGHVSCARRRVELSKPSCGGSTPRALALGGAAPAFLLLTGGVLGSVVLLAVEILLRRMRD